MAHAFEALVASNRALLSLPDEYQAKSPESQALDQIATAKAEFESWISHRFGCFANDAARVQEGESLAPIVIRLLGALNGLLSDGLLRRLPIADAELCCLYNHSLSRLERQCLSNSASSAVLMLVLSLVDDILAFLSLQSEANVGIPGSWDK